MVGIQLSAANKTLEILDETTALGDMERYGLELQAGISRILDARQIVEQALKIAADICIYTNHNLTIETLEDV